MLGHIYQKKQHTPNTIYPKVEILWINEDLCFEIDTIALPANRLGF